MGSIYIRCWPTLTNIPIKYTVIYYSSNGKLIRRVNGKRYLALPVSVNDALHPVSSSERSYIFTSLVSEHLNGNLLIFFGIESAGIGVSWVKLLSVFPEWSRKYLVMSSRFVLRGFSFAYHWERKRNINYVNSFQGRKDGKAAIPVLWNKLINFSLAHTCFQKTCAGCL